MMWWQLFSIHQCPRLALSRRCALACSGGAAGDAVSGVVRGFAAFLVDGVTFDEVGLRDVGEIEIVVEGSGSPDLTRLDESMIGWVNGEGVGGLPILEVAYEILMQRWLISFDGEVIVGAALDHEVIGQLPLGQQSIGRDVLVVKVDGRQQRDGHRDFVGSLPFIGVAVYGQGTDFFWV